MAPTARRPATTHEPGLALDAKNAKAHVNLATLLVGSGASDDRATARVHLRRAIELAPDLPEAWFELARLERRAGRLRSAIAMLQRVLELRPEDLTALIDLGALYQLTLEVPRAIAPLERACALAPESPLARYNLAQALAELGERDRAEVEHRRVLALTPEAIHSRLAVAKAERDRCDWDSWEATVEALESLDQSAIDQAPAPFLLNLFPVSPQLHREVARSYARRFVVQANELGGPLGRRRPAPRERLRVGFLGADFRHHPVGHLCHGIFSRFDRARILPFAYSLLPVDDEVTAKVRAGCELFRDCARLSDEAVARQIVDDEIDLLVDLTGFTSYSRPTILALRPAPLQVQHMGYVNTMGAPFLDYQVVDATVVGDAQRPFFDERLIYLPDCLFPVSPHGTLAATGRLATRDSEGLPPDCPVLCSFNAPSKLDPPTFAAWMAILRRVPAAVLWLFDGDESRLPEHLRRAAEAEGVAAERLFFAGKRPYPEHLMRYALADLFLDSFAYNGGATAVDALRQGLPVLTRLGEVPLARMGASVVRAAGLGELVAGSTEAYIELGVELAANPPRLRAFAERAARREGVALFDLDRWVRGYEDAMLAAWECAIAGNLADVGAPSGSLPPSNPEPMAAVRRPINGGRGTTLWPALKRHE